MSIPPASKAVTKLPAIPEPTSSEEGKAATLAALKNAMDILGKNAAGLEDAGVFVRVADYADIKTQVATQVSQSVSDPQSPVSEKFAQLVQEAHDFSNKVDEAIAAARKEFDALADRVEAEGQVLYDVQNTLGPNGASFRSSLLVDVNENSAIAGRVDKLVSRVGDSSASLKDEIITEVNTSSGSLAGRVTTIEANYADKNNVYSKASIDSAFLAKADLNSALATSSTTVGTTLNGINATATQALSSYNSTTNGVGIKYGVTGNINGATGGFVLTGVARNDKSKTSGQLTPTADYLLEITSNVIINGDLLVNGTISTSKVGANQISQVWNNNITGYAYGDGAYHNMISISFSLPSASPVIVTCFAQQDYTGSSIGHAYSALYVDGAVWAGASTGDGWVASSLCLAGSKILSAGSHTAVLSWQGRDSNVLLGNRTLVVTSLYR